MGKIAEIQREIDQATVQVQHKRERRNHWREVARRENKNVSQQREAINEAKEERDDNRAKLVVVRDRLEVITDDEIISSEEEERHKNLTIRLENLVDENEELTALIHRVLPRLHDNMKDHEEAAKLRRQFGNEFEQAIRNRKRLNEQLKEARENRQSRNVLSEHFVVAEFDCRDGTPVPEASIPALKHLCQNYLEPLRRSAGVVHINSGFRTSSYNRAVGGATLSIHVYNGSYQHSPFAVAADHWQEGRTPASVHAYHESHTHPDGMGKYTTFTHVDNRNRIGWSDSRWNGP